MIKYLFFFFLISTSSISVSADRHDTVSISVQTQLVSSIAALRSSQRWVGLYTGPSGPGQEVSLHCLFVRPVNQLEVSGTGQQ